MKLEQIKGILLILLLIAVGSIVTFAAPFDYESYNLRRKYAQHKHSEASYQKAWCNAHGGILEYENEDFTRVDCLTKTHAVEFDFANKWAESMGQALHYGIMTSKKPMVVLIIDEPTTQTVYYKRVKKIADKYKFDVKYVTNDILKLDNDGKCFNPKCKCHKCK